MMLRRVESADGRRCIEVMQREAGTYQFREGNWYPPTDGEYGRPEGFWGYLFVSGVYASPEEAEKEAIIFLNAERGSIFRADDC